VPPNLIWDLWLGPAPERPYLNYWPEGTPSATRGHNRQHLYCPFTWRGWWDFGCGALGDMGCHIMDGPNSALKFDAPASVELVSSSERTPEMPPASSIIRYEFPARGEMPACIMTWYDSGQKPPRPTEMEADKLPSNGSLFIGDKGKIMAGTYGERPHLLPESRMADYKRPDKTLPRVPGNSPHQDFLRACKGGPPACSNFEVSGPFTEWVLLGNLAIRVGGKLEWDAEQMKVKNIPEASRFIRTEYRDGWNVSAT
jgi:predicted dehydrogenase